MTDLNRYTPRRRVHRVRTHQWPQAGWVIGPRVSETRKAVTTMLVVLIAVVAVWGIGHIMFSAWDKQCAIDEAKNAQQWADFYAAQDEK